MIRYVHEYAESGLSFFLSNFSACVIQLESIFTYLEPKKMLISSRIFNGFEIGLQPIAISKQSCSRPSGTRTARVPVIGTCFYALWVKQSSSSSIPIRAFLLLSFSRLSPEHLSSLRCSSRLMARKKERIPTFALE